MYFKVVQLIGVIFLIIKSAYNIKDIYCMYLKYYLIVLNCSFHCIYILFLSRLSEVFHPLLKTMITTMMKYIETWKNSQSMNYILTYEKTYTLL